MSTPYISQITAFAFSFAPRGWALCNGQLLSIQQNQALFSLIGTTYGGNGLQTFGLPNLQGQVAVGMGQGPGLANYVIGQVSGEVNHTLLISEVPQHVHPPIASAASPTTASPLNAFPAQITQDPYAATVSSAVQLVSSPFGSNQPHTNQQPYSTLNFCMALQGIFPSRN